MKQAYQNKKQTVAGRTLPVVIVAGALLLAACSNMSPTEQRVLSGAGIGAAAGAGVTAVTGGCVSCGAAVGAGVGAAGGYIVDQNKK